MCTKDANRSTMTVQQHSEFDTHYVPKDNSIPYSDTLWMLMHVYAHTLHPPFWGPASRQWEAAASCHWDTSTPCPHQWPASITHWQRAHDTNYKLQLCEDRRRKHRRIDSFKALNAATRVYNSHDVLPWTGLVRTCCYVLYHWSCLIVFCCRRHVRRTDRRATPCWRYCSRYNNHRQENSR